MFVWLILLCFLSFKLILYRFHGFFLEFEPFWYDIHHSHIDQSSKCRSRNLGPFISHYTTQGNFLAYARKSLMIPHKFFHTNPVWPLNLHTFVWNPHNLCENHTVFEFSFYHITQIPCFKLLIIFHSKNLYTTFKSLKMHVFLVQCRVETITSKKHSNTYSNIQQSQVFEYFVQIYLNISKKYSNI
jgi:hypothetical protein